MTEVTLLSAFVAGTLALLSPCSALLVPSFFAYAFTSPGALAMRTGVFFAGLATVLVPLGVGAGAVSSLVYEHRSTTITVAGSVIIALGVWQLFGRGFAMPFANRLQRAGGENNPNAGIGSTFVLGAVYGLAGFCSGPVLGAILTMAAASAVLLHGGLLLATYALGMAAPLFVLALLWDRFDLGRRGWLRGRGIVIGPIQTHTTSVVSGVLFVAIGVLFIRFDGMVGFTSAIGLGDTSGLEVSVSDRVLDWVGRVPGWVLPAAVALGAAVVAWRRSGNAAPLSTDEDDRAERHEETEVGISR